MIPTEIPLVFQPEVQAPYCGTVYYLNVTTQTLAGFSTTSNRYATAQGTRVGMSSVEAARREGQPPYALGCQSSNIRLGNIEGYAGRETPVEIDIFVGTGPTDTVTNLTVENFANQVGVLFC